MKQSQAYLFEKISKQIQQIDSIPLFGNGPPLNFEEFSFLLAKQFGIDDFTVRFKAGQWKEKEEIQEQNKGKMIIQPVILSPIDSPIFWVLSKTDRDKLTGQMLSDKPNKKAFSSSVLQEGFYRFLLLEVLSIAQELHPIQQMTLVLPEEKIEIPNEDGICIDVEIGFGTCTAWGRLILPESFRKNWVQHFSAFPPPYIPNKLSKQLPLEIGIKIGSIELSQKEWKKLNAGDFLLPDILSTENTGVLVLDQIPLFQVYIHQNQIELIDYDFNTEDNMEESENAIEDTLSHKLEIAEKESKAIKNIPLQINIEIARLKITLDQLMKLSPGNLLELPPLADKKVSLIANGQKIGVAELVYLGETLGLKILEI